MYLQSWWAHQRMMSGCWVHPAGVVMGSRWLVVPTPTAQSLVRVRVKASLCLPSRSMLVSHLQPSALRVLQLYSIDECSDIRTDRQVKKAGQVEAFVGDCQSNKTTLWLEFTYANMWGHFCIQDRFSYLTISLFGVQLCNSCKKYTSLRVQCFVKLEIFLPEQL